jgi:uncharacterized protein (TIGR03437 family)
VLAVTGQLGTLAGNGTRGFSGDGGDATLATLDTPRGLAVDSSGNVYVADSGNRRIRYVTAPSASGPSIISTIPEPNAAIWRNLAGLAVDAQGSVYAADATDQRVFRMDPPGSILTIAGNGAEGFSGEAGPGLSETLDTPAGIVLDNTGNAYLADSNNGRIRMLTPASGALQTGPAAGPGLTLVNAASLQPGSIAPGELISIFGPGLGPAAGVTATQPSLQLGGTQVFFNGRQAPLTYVGLNQIDVQAPYSLGEVRPCVVQVVVNGVIQAQTQAQVADSAPAIFTVGGGSGQAAVLNEDGSYNSVDNPASRGSVVVLFATGEGQTAPAGIEGQPAGSPAPAPVLPVSLTIGGYRADLLYAAEAPGFAGLLQVNARVPAGFAPPGILPVTLQVGTATSPAGVTVAVQ